MESPQQLLRIHQAFRAGDLEALRSLLDDPAQVPNGPMPLGIGHCLEYAIYHSPLSFIRTLLELGADPRPNEHTGFPPLIAALCCSRSQPGSPAREDVLEIIALLLAHGADPDQRGVNDYTALHMAVAERNRPALELLLACGADPHLKTRIDQFETARQMAEAGGQDQLAALIRTYE